MSSVNLDLVFQDYTPSASGGGSRTIDQQPETQVRIPSPPTENRTSNFKQNLQTAKSVLNIVQSLSNPQSGQASGLSEETIQQLIWLSDKQKNKNQRSSIAASSSWGLGYFAQYFDVTTHDVLQRILWSAIPIRKTGIDVDDLSNTELTAPLARSMGDTDNVFSPSTNPDDIIFEQLGGKKKQYSYIERFIQSRPDFYGPFWISTTLVFVVALFSNLVSYSKYKAKVFQYGNPESLIGNVTTDILTLEKLDKLEAWHYSVDELNMAASFVTFYVTLLPTFLWFLFWFRGCAKYYTLMETMCAYGYSLSIFVPLTVLLVIQATLFRYFVLLVAASMSGFVLVMSFVPMVRSDQSGGKSHIILVIVLACQVGAAYILHRIMLQ